MSDTIFEALRHDHDRQRTLIAELLDTTGDSDKRRRAYDELKVELSAHAMHEERQFYVPLMSHDKTQEHARHSIAEHHELDELVEQLDGYDMSGPQWIQSARDLAERLTHHLDEEEREIFPVAGKVLSDDEKRTLAGAYEAAMFGERRVG